LKFSKQVNSAEFEEAVNVFIEVIQFSKLLRPKAQWAYWDIPGSIYYVEVDAFWQARYDGLERLLSEVDILMPHLYDYYPDGVRSAHEDSAYIQEILKKTLEKAVKFKKPVLPFIWHRYSDAIKETGLISINEIEFLRQLKEMCEVSYEGKKINGVIWWHEDLYFINIEAPNIMKEMGTKNRDSYRDEVLYKYWSLAKEVLVDN